MIFFSNELMKDRSDQLNFRVPQKKGKEKQVGRNFKNEILKHLTENTDEL